MLNRIRIVLVEPSHPGNIGGAARAMKTMGLSDLVVVAPRRFPDPQADWRAAGALDVLDAARVVEDVPSAVGDCHMLVGTSTRNRKIPWPIGDAKEIAAKLQQALVRDDTHKVAVLFGREDSGLTNEELRLCHAHLQIPANPTYSSLNLAMAVQVVCYELFQIQAEAPPALGWDRRMATQAEVNGMLEHLDQVLTSSGFIQADNPGQTMTRLRRMFARIEPDETEIQILRGVIKHLDEQAGGQPE